MAASVLLSKERRIHPEWQPIKVNTLFDLIMRLHQNIKGTALEEPLSRMGGVRLTKDDVVRTGNMQKLKAYYPVIHWSDEGVF